MRIRDLPTAEERRAATQGARLASQNAFAGRAVDDPAKLARAARIVRIALERRKLTLADVVPDEADVA